MRAAVFSLALVVLTIMVVAQECPYGVTRVYCFINPCHLTDQLQNCANIPSARCVPDYCGGCYRRWYVGRYDVTRQCYPGERRRY